MVEEEKQTVFKPFTERPGLRSGRATCESLLDEARVHHRSNHSSLRLPSIFSARRSCSTDLALPLYKKSALGALVIERTGFNTKAPRVTVLNSNFI